MKYALFLSVRPFTFLPHVLFGKLFYICIDFFLSFLHVRLENILPFGCIWCADETPRFYVNHYVKDILHAWVVWLQASDILFHVRHQTQALITISTLKSMKSKSPPSFNTHKHTLILPLYSTPVLFTCYRKWKKRKQIYIPAVISQFVLLYMWAN